MHGALAKATGQLLNDLKHLCTRISAKHMYCAEPARDLLRAEGTRVQVHGALAKATGQLLEDLHKNSRLLSTPER